MSDEFIGKKTLIAFRDFLSGWTIREITNAFEVAGVHPDPAHAPAVSGQRRSLVEQHYHALNLSVPEDAHRLTVAFEHVLVEAQQRLASAIDKFIGQPAIDKLVACLEADGLKYDKGKILPATSKAQRIFQSSPASRTISEVTRRNIFDGIFISGVAWSGRLGEDDFLARLYDLDALPTTDPRFKTFASDIWQHRVNNHDWPDDWVFTDSRVDLLHAADDKFTRFLCEMVHPAVRTAQDEVEKLVSLFNKYLVADRWEIVTCAEVSGRPVFSARRKTGAHISLPSSQQPTDVLTDDYVQELATKCDGRLATGDFEGAITTGRTFLEAILVALEERIVGARGDYKGDLPKQFKKVAKLLKMDDERPDLDDRFKDVVRGLFSVVSGLAPLRNKMSDGHARERKPAPHHARVVVNAAKTVAAFLVESYRFQRAKGLLPVPSRPGDKT